MIVWEYNVVDMEADGTPLGTRLMQLGKQGWELVTVVPKPGTTECIRYIFKRPQPDMVAPPKEEFRARGW